MCDLVVYSKVSPNRTSSERKRVNKLAKGMLWLEVLSPQKRCWYWRWRKFSKVGNLNWQDKLKYTKTQPGASLVAQWLRIRLPMQGIRVRALVWEGPTCRGATKPVSHNYWAHALHLLKPTRSRAHAPQQEKPLQWEACAPQRRVAPTRCNWRKTARSNEDPTQPKIINK